MGDFEPSSCDTKELKGPGLKQALREKEIGCEVRALARVLEPGFGWQWRRWRIEKRSGSKQGEGNKGNRMAHVQKRWRKMGKHQC
eukprot:4862786-Pleurochrysis_carterae.AAC.1